MTESQLYAKLKTGLSSYKIKMTRIETGGMELGVPDIAYRTINQDGWIEMKIIPQYSRGQIKVPFRPGQMGWIRSYRRLRGAIFLFLVIENDLCILSRHDIREVYNEDLFPVVSRFQIVGRSNVNWSHLYDTLNSS